MTVRRLCYIKLMRRFTGIGSRAGADSLFPTDLITADAPINSSSPTVLVVAVGGANDGLQNTQSDGTYGSLSPISPYNGGDGYVSGQVGNGRLSYGANNAYGGQGGQSYVISRSIHVQDSLGNGGYGRYGAPGGNRYVDISFYS